MNLSVYQRREYVNTPLQAVYSTVLSVDITQCVEQLEVSAAATNSVFKCRCFARM